MSEPAPNDKTGIAGIAVVALAVACCAGGPLVVAAVGSFTVGTLIGAGAGIVLLAAACTLLYLRHRPGGRSS